MPEVQSSQAVQTASQAVQTDQAGGTQTGKGFDPTKLAPELQETYKSMQADYTRKTQELAEQRKTFESQIADLQRQYQEATGKLTQYEQYVLPYLSALKDSPKASDAATEPVASAPKYDPMDEESARAYTEWVIGQKAKEYSDQFQQALKAMQDQQQFNWSIALQVPQLSQKYPKFNIQEVWGALPKYGYDVQRTAQALYEAPERYQAADQVPTLQKQVEALTKQIEEMQKQVQGGGVLGQGTVHSTVRRIGVPSPQTKTLLEAVADIRPEQYLIPSE
jgi:chromosome segregation ATPase